MHRILGKTTDGGKHWEVFNVDEKPEIRNILSQSTIEKIEIDKTGNGKMFFKGY